MPPFQRTTRKPHSHQGGCSSQTLVLLATAVIAVTVWAAFNWRNLTGDASGLQVVKVSAGNEDRRSALHATAETISAVSNADRAAVNAIAAAATKAVASQLDGASAGKSSGSSSGTSSSNGSGSSGRDSGSTSGSAVTTADRKRARATETVAPECHISPNNELHGSVVVWGDQLLKDSASACCDACRKTQQCNVWVWCGESAGCGYGTNVRKRGECWLKKAELDDVLPNLGKGHQGITWTAGALFSAAEGAAYEAAQQLKVAEDVARRQALKDNPELPLVYMDVSIKEVPAGRILAVLFAKESPLATENMRCLCTGEMGVAPPGHEGAGEKYHLKGSYFYRIIDRFIDQTGARTDSIYGGDFRDDTEGLKLKHTRQGLLSLANNGANTNGAHFSMVMGPAPHLNTHYGIFGEIVEGLNITDAVNKLAYGQKNNELLNSKDAQITDAGQLRRGTLVDSVPYQVMVAGEKLRVAGERSRSAEERTRLAALKADTSIPLVYFDIAIKGVPVGRVEFVLFAKESPMAAENFRLLCTGEKGVAPEGHEGAGRPYHFKGNYFYRIIEGFIDQTGTSTDSAFGGLFNDDAGGLKLEHTRKGLLSMANIGPNTNGGHCSIMQGPAPHLNGHYTIFGEIVSGLWITEQINALAHGQPDRSWLNKEDAKIVDAGQLRQGAPFDASLHNITAVAAQDVHKRRMQQRKGRQRQRHRHRTQHR